MKATYRNDFLLALVTATLASPLLAQQDLQTLTGDAVFNWAEYAYPRLFSPAGSTSQTVNGYYSRSYSTTQTFLGFRNDTVYGSGTAFTKFSDAGNGVRLLGPLSVFSAGMAADGYGVASGEKLIVSEAASKDNSGGADWFELYNAGSTTIALNTYQIRDESSALLSLPATSLAPGQYLVITASEKIVSDGRPRVALSLGESDRLQLYKSGTLVDELAWDNNEAEHGLSIGHYPGPTGKIKTLVPTPGKPNKAKPGRAREDFGGVGTLLSSQVHDVSVSFDPAAYTKIVETYRNGGGKDWMEATVTIDGVSYPRAGMRLKGNSSLRSVSTSSDPATVPWLIKLNKFVDGQKHLGLDEFVIRSNGTQSALNEAVSLELLEEAGLLPQDSVEVRFTTNNGTTRLRLATDNPNDEWMAERFSATGALYKAEAGGDYSYRGDDAASYDNIFDQEAGKANTDLKPLIGFLKFINQSDDATFQQELPTRFNVDSFATYLAMNDLLNNFDDIDGPGNNSYLYYDTRTAQFTIVPWDYNLAFGQTAGLGGAVGQIPGGQIPGGQIPGGQIPGGGGRVPNAGGQLPAGQIPGVQFPAGGFGRSNILVTRFLAVPAWNALYQARVNQLRSKLYFSGIASAVLGLWTEIVAESGKVPQTTLDTEAASIASSFK